MLSATPVNNQLADLKNQIAFVTEGDETALADHGIPSITEIRRLNPSPYALLRYVLPHKQAAYDQKYSTRIRGGEGFFRQADREESLVHLLRVNVLKRMESAVPSFALTLERQLADVEAILRKVESHVEAVEQIDIEDIDVDDPAFESLLVGTKVKVLLRDVDLVRWRQDLIEDWNRLATLCAAARQSEDGRVLLSFTQIVPRS